MVRLHVGSSAQEASGSHVLLRLGATWSLQDAAPARVIAGHDRKPVELHPEVGMWPREARVSDWKQARRQRSCISALWQLTSAVEAIDTALERDGGVDGVGVDLRLARAAARTTPSASPYRKPLSVFDRKQRPVPRGRPPAIPRGKAAR